MTTVQTLRTPCQAAPLLAWRACEYDGMSGYLNQGIGVATGLQKKFDWRGVAASAVGAGVGHAVGGAMGMHDLGFKDLSFGQQFGARLVTGLAAGAATAVMRGGKVAIQQVAVDAFGNALGYSLAEASTSPPTNAMGAGPASAAQEHVDNDAAYRLPGRYVTSDNPDPVFTGNGLQVGRGLGLRVSSQTVQNWSDGIDAGVAQMRAAQIAAQSAKAAAATAARIDPVAEVLGFAQSYPALGGEVAALERAVQNKMLTVDQARDALLNSPRAHMTLRKDFETPDVASTNSGPYLSAWDGKSPVIQAADPRADAFHYKAARSTAEGLLTVAGPEAVLGNLALKGAVAAYGAVRFAGAEATSLLMRTGERTALDTLLVGERASLSAASEQAVIRERVLANIAETRAGNAASRFDIHLARTDQIRWGYAADDWSLTTLKAGDRVFGGLPGQSSYYTSGAALEASGGSRAALFQGLQVKPHSEFGYRPMVGEYELVRTTTVPRGITAANPGLGAGGAEQFFIRDFQNSLRLIQQIPLGK